MSSSYVYSMQMIGNDSDSKIISTEQDIMPFNNKDFNFLFKEYRETIVNSLITAFGLDMLIFKDIQGGNVQTVHNAEQGVYATDEYRQRGERDYNRDDYASSSYMNKRRKNDFQLNDKIIDGYTGKELPKDGRAHLEHVVSAKEVHDHTGMRVLMSKNDMANVVNSNQNTIYTEASLNMSKSDSELTEWAIKPNRHNSQLTNAEYYNLDPTKSIAVDKGARKYLDAEFAKKRFDHYASSFSQDALKQGGAMALRQSLGLVLTQLAIVITERLPSFIQEMRSNFSLESFIDGIGAIIKESFEKIKSKSRQLFESATRGFTSGILSSLMTTIINIFFTTSKNIVRIIRQTMSSITEAVSILFFDKSGRSSGQKVLAAAKVLLTGISVVIGVIIDQGVEALLTQVGVSTVPIFGPVITDVFSTFCGVLVTGIMSVTILYFLEHSEVIKSLIAFIDRIYQDCFDKVIIKMAEANRLLDEYIAKLCELDTQALKKQIDDLREVSKAIESGNTEAMYSYCKSYGINLPFYNSHEFVAFITNKDEVFEI